MDPSSLNLLLDTHALLWMFGGDARVGSAAETLVEKGGRSVHVSVVSFWEIVIKSKLGKLHAVPTSVRKNVARLGWTVIGVEGHHLAALEALVPHHKDPFDHLLIAQAIAENLTIVTDDRHMPLYPVRCMACAG